MADFHFLRPAWLLLLPLALWAAWRLGIGRGGLSGWRAVVDRALQPFVLAEGDKTGQRLWPLLTAMLAVVLATAALAGPAWDRLPVPAYRSDESLVIALDLSRSMDAGDVEPSRLARAKLKLMDLLDRRASGQTALVVFSANAFTVTPLTTDTKTIGSLIGALSTDIMPSQGSLLEVGLNKAAELLRQAGVRGGEILLITDAVPSPGALDRVAELGGSGIATHVLAVGTEQGAPIPAQDGGFVNDRSGQVVVPQLDADALQRLARRGGGRFARLAVGDSDLDRLFPRGIVGDAAVETEEEGREVEIWRDQGIWLTLALLPLVAAGFRRGWVYLLVAGLVGSLALPVPRAEAFEWHDLWLRPDQQGREALERDAPEEAAALFDDPEWRAAARYRAGQYEQSAADLTGIDTADAHYNRGNALARAGRLAEAVEAYDESLALAPDHADAAHNRELVADLLEQQQQQQGQQQGQRPGQESQQGQQASTGSGQQDQAGEPGDERGEQPQQGERTAQSGGQDGRQAGEQPGEPESSAADRSQDPGQSESQAANEQRPDPAAGDNQAEPVGSEPPGEERQASAAPDDLEDWASEQAAEQWLRRIPQDPGGLLRRKFLYQYQQLGIDQDGNAVWPGDTTEPW